MVEHQPQLKISETNTLAVYLLVVYCKGKIHMRGYCSSSFVHVPVNWMSLTGGARHMRHVSFPSYCGVLDNAISRESDPLSAVPLR